MKALLFRLDGKVTEFEVRGSPPYFILVESNRDVLFRRLVGEGRLDDYGGNSVAQYAENGIKSSYFDARATEAALHSRFDYAKEMQYMAGAVARPEFSVPVVGKIERYAAWVHNQYFAPAKLPDHYVIEPIKISAVQWNPPLQYEDIWNPPLQYEDIWNPPLQYEDMPFSNVTYTPKPEPPPREPDVIGEPKKRLLLIVKDLTIGNELE